MYVYDIELPQGVIPKPYDDEVKAFYCMSISEVQTAMLSQKFKPDAAVVLIDFMIRQGIVTAENERDYAEIIMHLHRRLPFCISPTAASL